MKINVGSSQTTSNIGSSGRSFGIVASGKAFRILSSSLYNFKPLAVVREISCNARDAHAMCDKLDVPFDVRLPCIEDLHFAVRDYGPGMSDEDILGLYTTYFASTKTETNDAIGGMGLGSKSPLSYSSSFQVTSYFEGKKRTYLAFQNDNGEPDIYRLLEVDSSEPSGLEVVVPVAETDVTKFHRSAADVYRFFEIQPNVKIGSREIDREKFYQFELSDIVRKEVVYEDDLVARFYESRVISEISNEAIWAKMGDVIYPVSISHVFDENTDVQQRKITQFFKYARFGKAVIDCRIGELDINAGREGLSYDKATISRLQTILSTIYSKLVHQVNSEVAAATHLDKALKQCFEYRDFFGELAIDGMFTWQGISLKTESYNTLPNFRKKNKDWMELEEAITKDADDVMYSYIRYHYRTDVPSVRALNASNWEKLHLAFSNDIVWVIVDEVMNGKNGQMRDRIAAAYPNQNAQTVYVVRGIEWLETKTGDSISRLAHASVAARKAEIQKLIDQNKAFSTIHFLSDLPVTAKPASGATRSTSTSGGPTATRLKDQVYFVESHGHSRNLFRNTVYQIEELDEDCQKERLYVVGNKAKVKLFDSSFGVSRSSDPSYSYHYYSLSYLDLFHHWVDYRTDVLKEKTKVYVLSEAQAERLTTDAKWIRADHQMCLDAGKAFTTLGEYAHCSMTGCFLNDNRFFEALKRSSAKFAATTQEWLDMKREVDDQISKVNGMIYQLRRHPEIIKNQWELFYEGAGLTASVPVEQFTEIAGKSTSFHFGDYVNRISPLLNTMRVTNDPRTVDFNREIARLWDESPNKLSVQEYIALVMEESDEEED